MYVPVDVPFRNHNNSRYYLFCSPCPKHLHKLHFICAKALKKICGISILGMRELYKTQRQSQLGSNW